MTPSLVRFTRFLVALAIPLVVAMPTLASKHRHAPARSGRVEGPANTTRQALAVGSVWHGTLTRDGKAVACQATLKSIHETAIEIEVVAGAFKSSWWCKRRDSALECRNGVRVLRKEACAFVRLTDPLLHGVVTDTRIRLSGKWREEWSGRKPIYAVSLTLEPKATL